MGAEIDNIIAQGPAHKKFHGQIIYGLGICPVHLLLGGNPPVHDHVLHRISHCLKQFLRRGILNFLAVCILDGINNGTLKFLFIKPAASGIHRLFRHRHIPCPHVHNWYILLLMVFDFLYSKCNALSVNIPVLCVASPLARENLLSQNICFDIRLISPHETGKSLVAILIDPDMINDFKSCFLPHSLDLAHQLPDKSLFHQFRRQIGIQHHSYGIVRLGHIAFLVSHVDKQIFL